MIVVRSRPQRIWDVEGFDHTLDCGCHYFGGEPAPHGKLRALPVGAYVFCGQHESVQLQQRRLAS